MRKALTIRKIRFLIYLASKSTRRQQILTNMNIPFRVVSTPYRERFLKNKTPTALAIHHARAKARKAIIPFRARFILAGDTIVWCRNRFLGKPKNRSEALRMIRTLSGRSHAVYTGLVLWDRKSGQMFEGCAKTRVWIKRLSDREVRQYVDTINPFDKAGAYAIQEKPRIVKKIQGSHSNVVGLPRELLRKMLDKILKRAEY